jgi:hypothetical protein
MSHYRDPLEQIMNKRLKHISDRLLQSFEELPAGRLTPSPSSTAHSFGQNFNLAQSDGFRLAAGDDVAN